MANNIGTDLTVNGVLLKNVNTLEFSQTPVRDPSDTDRWYNDIEIRVESICNVALLQLGPNAANLGVFPPSSSGSGTTADLVAGVKCLLGQDRKNVSYVVDGVQLVGFDVDKNGPDFNNGPKVSHFRVTHFNRQTIRIELGLKLAIICCNSDVNSSDPTISNRWSLIDDIDEQFRTTRTWRGVLRLAPGTKLDQVRNPQAFRNLVVPPLSDGFERIRMNFVSQPNGLELGYDVTDREMLGQAAPWPASKMVGMHSETVGLDATGSMAMLSVRLDGPADADKEVMIERCVQIAEQKLALSKINDDQNIIQSFQIVNHFGNDQNAVECRAITRHILGKDQSGSKGGSSQFTSTLGALVMSQIGKPLALPNYNDQKNLIYGPYGTASLATLFVAAYQDPCGTAQKIGDANTVSPGDVDNKPATAKDTGQSQTKAFSFTGDPSQAFKSPGYSSDHNAAIYSWAQIETVTRNRQMRIALPLALSAGDEQSGKNTATLVRLGAAVSYLTVRAAFERNGEWPTVISAIDFKDGNGIQYWNTESDYNTRAPKLLSDGGGSLYAVDWEAEYAMSRPLKQGETFAVTSLPWDKTPTSQGKMPTAAIGSPTGPKGIN